MAAKKQQEQPVDRHRQPAMTLRLPEDFDAHLRALAEENARTLTAEIMVSLREYWKSIDRWPPGAKKKK